MESHSDSGSGFLHTAEAVGEIHSRFLSFAIADKAATIILTQTFGCFYFYFNCVLLLSTFTLDLTSNLFIYLFHGKCVSTKTSSQKKEVRRNFGVQQGLRINEDPRLS